MDAERWAKIDRLLDQAMEQAPEARAAFLAEACAGDDELRREVESLLEAYSQNDTFLSTPAIDIAARHLAADRQSSLNDSVRIRSSPSSVSAAGAKSTWRATNA